MAFRNAAFAFAALLSLASFTTAQTFTDCQPLNKTCPANPALGTNATFNFVQSKADDSIWNMTAGPMKYGTTNGADFTINGQGQAPTIMTNFHILFGEVTVEMQAARGQGIVSSIVLQSSDLDEIDWEFIGGNTTHVESNYFGKGVQDYTKSIWHPMPSGAIPQDGYHNYTLKWSKEQLEWLVDGNVVRTLLYADAEGGARYPQTPCNLRIGIWAGGDSSLGKGTIEWAGGLTDYKKAPFSMYVRSVYVRDAQDGARSYTYSDQSGSFESIKIEQGKSETAKELTTPQGVSGRWSALPQTTRTAIIASSLAGLALLVTGGLVFCCLQARKGRREKAIADAAWEKEQNEFNQYRMHMMKGGFTQQSHPI